jgi:hypothetical protein
MHSMGQKLLLGLKCQERRSAHPAMLFAPCPLSSRFLLQMPAAQKALVPEDERSAGQHETEPLGLWSFQAAGKQPILLGTLLAASFRS